MRAIAGAAVVVLIVVVGMMADEPWKSKPYQTWDEQDLRKVMFDSPWARRVQVTAHWQRQRGGDASGRDSVSIGRSSMGKGSSSSGFPTTAEEQSRPETVFVVRWASSRTQRQARARLSVLRGMMKEGDMEKFLAQVLTDYEVVILGQDMTPFKKTDEKTLMQKTYIRPKKSKLKLFPTKVEFERNPDGNSIGAVVFLFPKQTSTGEAVVAPDEKGVEFFCETPEARIQTNFELQKMGGKQGADL